MKNHDEFYLNLAEQISKTSKCLKGNWGAVIVRDDMIIGCGYNGTPRGVVHCNPCRRDSSAPGQDYHLCVAAHAECNAIIQAGGREKCLGATLYLDSHNRKPGSGGAYNSAMGFFPCDNCFRYIINAGIHAVVIRGMDLKPLWITVSSAVAQLNKKLYQTQA